MTKYEVDPNDFLIQISPSIDEEHNWTGEIAIDLIISTATSLCDDDHTRLLTLAKTICAAVPMYADNPELYSQALQYVAEAENAVNEGEDPIFFKQDYTREGNVINVNFSKEGK